MSTAELIVASPELISFDVWMTLIRSNPDYKQAQSDLISRRLGIRVEGFTELMKDEDRATDKESDQSGIQYGPVERIGRIVRRVGAQASTGVIEELSNDIQDLFADYPVQLMEPGLLAALDDIRAQGYRTALVSNTGFIDGNRMRLALDEVGILGRIDHAIFSNEVGVAKPNPAMYQALATTAGVALPNILHIGDNYHTDYIGPRALRMQSIHLSEISEAAHHVDTIADLQASLLTLEYGYERI